MGLSISTILKSPKNNRASFLDKKENEIVSIKPLLSRVSLTTHALYSCKFKDGLKLFTFVSKIFLGILE